MKTREEARPLTRVRVRLLLLGLLSALAVVAIALRLSYLTILAKEEYEARGLVQYQRRLKLDARRGTIHDRHGRALAQSVEVDSLYAVPSSFTPERAQEAAGPIARCLGLPKRKVLGQLQGRKDFAWLERKAGAEARRCIEALQTLLAASGGRLTLLEDDATAVDAASLGPPPRHIVANLPYNVSTVLLVAWLRQAEAFAGMTLMFQKEVADRIAAKPGSKIYGRLSVMAAWRCDLRVLFNLPARAFTPPPKVASSVVRFTPLPSPRYPAAWDAMETVVAAAFGQRRKMLRGALRSLKVDSDRLLEAAGVDPEARAETLSVEQFAALARAYATLT